MSPQWRSKTIPLTSSDLSWPSMRSPQLNWGVSSIHTVTFIVNSPCFVVYFIISRVVIAHTNWKPPQENANQNLFLHCWKYTDRGNWASTNEKHEGAFSHPAWNVTLLYWRIMCMIIDVKTKKGKPSRCWWTDDIHGEHGLLRPEVCLVCLLRFPWHRCREPEKRRRTQERGETEMHQHCLFHKTGDVTEDGEWGDHAAATFPCNLKSKK